MSVNKPRIAVVGATGAVGQTFLQLFQERQFPFAQLFLIASKRSAGRTVAALGKTHEIHCLEGFDFSKVDIAFFSAGTSVSRDKAQKAAEQGALVIDNTNAFRMQPEVPLIVPQVNGHVLQTGCCSRIIANPNCATIPMVRVMKPIDEEFGLIRLVISTYQAASGRGLQGMSELKEDTRHVLSDGKNIPEVKRFGCPLAFNVIPHIDTLLPTGFTLEEQKMVQESRKILNRPSLKVTATAVRVPILNGHSEAVYFECERALNRNRILQLLAREKEMNVHDTETTYNFPTPRFLGDPNYVHVGRIRLDPDNNCAGWVWIVSDNLRIGAALNAVQIAERIIGL